METKAKTIFDFLNDITFNKVAWEDQVETKRFHPYMLNRWLSMTYLEIVAEVQPVTSRMEPREFYKFYSDILPKRKFFSKYVKAAGVESKWDALADIIADKMQVSKKEALDIIDLSLLKGTDDLKQFLSDYGYSEKEMKTKFKLT